MSDNEVPHRLRISRTEDARGYHLNSNGRDLYFDNAMWDELTRMMSDMRATGAREMANFTEHLPVRTPIHANTPIVPRKKPTLDDLA